MTDDDKANFLIRDFEKYGIGTDLITIHKGYDTFFSIVMLSEESASRTIVFDKGNTPALSLNDKQKEAVKNAELLLVDGNEMSAAVEAARIAKENGTKVLLDAGGLYDGIKELLALTDILIPSYEFSLGITGAKTAEDAAKILFETYKPEVVVITKGKEGGIIYDGKEIISYPAFKVEAVDSNGAGDGFSRSICICRSKGL